MKFNCCVLAHGAKLINALRLLGYTHMNKELNYGCIFTTNTLYGEYLEDSYSIPSSYSYANTESIQLKEYIHCGVNPILFLAIAAITETNDRWQFFIKGDSIKLCSEYSFSFFAEKNNFNPSGYTKATPKELRKILTCTI